LSSDDQIDKSAGVPLPSRRKRPRSTDQAAKAAAQQPADATAATGDRIRGKGIRQAAAQATRECLLKAATTVFARHGYAGGSIDKISSLARSYDRMIYYYFGSKEGLFIAVLEGIYHRMDVAEARCQVDMGQPIEALKSVIRFKVNYYRKNPEFVTLLNVENLQKGKHVAKSQKAREYSKHAVALIDEILASGVEKGLFRNDLKPRDVYLLIVSTAYFFTSNRFTLSAFLGEPITQQAAAEHWERFVADSVLRVVRASPEAVPLG
jgi:AcrR family transcriptional regulator